MFKIFRRNYNFSLKLSSGFQKYLSTQSQPKVAEIKAFKPENMSAEEEIKFYESEFQKIFKEKKQKYRKIYFRDQNTINNFLSDKEKLEVELILDRIMDLKGKDKIYFQLYIRNTLKRTLGFDAMTLNMQNPDCMAATQSFWPPNDPKWFTMNFSASGATGDSSGTSAKSGSAQSKGAAEEQKAPAKEVI
jgi:hypothetical protein